MKRYPHLIMALLLNIIIFVASLCDFPFPLCVCTQSHVFFFHYFAFFGLLLHFVIGIILPIIALCAVGVPSMLYLQQQQQQREACNFHGVAQNAMPKKRTRERGKRNEQLKQIRIAGTKAMAKLSTIHAV